MRDFIVNNVHLAGLPTKPIVHLAKNTDVPTCSSIFYTKSNRLNEK